MSCSIVTGQIDVSCKIRLTLVDIKNGVISIRLEAIGDDNKVMFFTDKSNIITGDSLEINNVKLTLTL